LASKQSDPCRFCVGLGFGLGQKKVKVQTQQQGLDFIASVEQEGCTAL
jgi:hypothetical protein